MTIGGLPLLTARIRMPYVGAWHAEVEADYDDEEPATNDDGTITLSVDGVDFVGTITRSTTFVGRHKAQVVGGCGGLSAELDSTHYTDTDALTIIRDILSDAGETLSDTTDTGAITTEFAGWERAKAPASRALTRICDATGLIWRVLADGTIWVGEESYPVTTVEHVLMDEDWAAGTIEIAPDAPDLTPGVTFRDQEIRYIVHHVERGGLRTEAYLESPGGLLDRFLAGIRQSVAYSRLYPCEVITQNSDGTLQVLPDDDTMRGQGLDHVPIRLGIPGFMAKVPAGTRVRLGFDDGDPSRPFAALWDEGEVTSVELVADDEVSVDASTTRINPSGGDVELGDTPANAVARVGDLVQISMVLAVPNPSQGVALTSPVGPVTGSLGILGLPIIAVGQILSGKDGVKA